MGHDAQRRSKARRLQHQQRGGDGRWADGHCNRVLDGFTSQWSEALRENAQARRGPQASGWLRADKMKRTSRAAHRKGTQQSPVLRVALAQRIPLPGQHRAAVTNVHVTVRNLVCARPVEHPTAGRGFLAMPVTVRTEAAPWCCDTDAPCWTCLLDQLACISQPFRLRGGRERHVGTLSPTAHARFEARSVLHHPSRGTEVAAEAGTHAATPYRVWPKFNGVFVSFLGDMSSLVDVVVPGILHRSTCTSPGRFDIPAANRLPPAITVTRTHRQRKRIETLDLPHWSREPCAGHSVDGAADHGPPRQERSAACSSHSQRRSKSKAKQSKAKRSTNDKRPSRQRMPACRNGCCMHPK
ncbi:uncharacterized protein CC84DRAFT_1179253 [Paraphaeosphaeria sporulosa]|uniref:Uncharacterized protein n=1 Tax=Paraphaeosphaeria sporulosa TaxID=1460663 RepID=A0A177C6K4_9PLEO|nr:uncharacterized protein CC84DRAFT_1179253 [Paraphaeosphaeria sporulosa]OAG02330.1 hypothetical protein CC84DRAFT_1179253 [Paraphaeosphaeria sporulosa]